MCYFVSLIKSKVLLEQRYQAKFLNEKKYKPKYLFSAFTLPFLPIIKNGDNKYIHMHHWGLIPFWSKDTKKAEDIRFKTFNARAETIFEKPSFKYPILRKRCLVPVNGFFEWREYKGKKYPYYVKLKSQEIFSLGGVWDSWKNNKSGEIVNTFSIITTPANPLLEKIHNRKKRMPVIINIENENLWIKNNTEKKIIKSLLSSYSEKNMETYPVSKLLSSRKSNKNDPNIIKKHYYPELPPVN